MSLSQKAQKNIFIKSWIFKKKGVLFMNNKFKLTDETITLPSGKVLHRIQALKSFGNIKEEDLGGFIEKEKNLSTKGNCWVYDNAYVYGNAYIADNAHIHDNAHIYDNAYISDYACIYDNAHIYGNANIYNTACAHNNACIFDNSYICGNACVYGNARIYGYACIYGNARVYDNACVYDNARVYGNARICGNGVLKEWNCINTSSCYTDIQNNLIENIRVQTNLIPINEEVIAYKQVNKDLSSFYDPNFKYRVGEWAEVTDYDPSSKSCVKGLHFSNPSYWNTQDLRKSTLLIARIKLEDIITVQEGKIRCKKAFILGSYDVE